MYKMYIFMLCLHNDLMAALVIYYPCSLFSCWLRCLLLLHTVIWKTILISWMNWKLFSTLVSAGLCTTRAMRPH